MSKKGLWVLVCAAIGTVIAMGGSFAGAQQQNTNSSQNRNSNTSGNVNSNMSGNMNSNMNSNMSGDTNANMSGNMNSNMSRDTNSNMSGNTNSNMGGEMNSNMSGNMNGNMNSNMRGDRNMNSNMSGGAMMAVNSSDRKFAMMAAQGGMAEVEMARVALERASSSEVKQYAQKMIDDHTKANEELVQIAQAKGITLTAAPDQKQMAMMEKMRNLSGAEFDRQYMMMAGDKDHSKMEKLFRDEVRKGRDAELKAFASKTLPVVQEHLRMAREINSSMKMGGGNMNSNRTMNMNSNSNGNSNR